MSSPNTESREFARAVALGLLDHPRWLPSRYLYDAEGSMLFERITATPEYYLTRAEVALLDTSADIIAGITRSATLVELGAGSARKAERILAAYTRLYDTARYVPVDVSGDALARTTHDLARRYPSVAVRGVHGTYETVLPGLGGLSPLVLLFLGSTIGNLNQTEAARFWRDVRCALAPEDFMLLGVDLVKDVGTIDTAYNDAAGWSAAFTKNIFARMNRELGSAVDLDGIAHEAAYRSEWRRVEIFARMTRRQEVRLAPIGRTITLAVGERVMTEISRKFDLTELREYLRLFDMETIEAFTDAARSYALLLLRPGNRDA
jgi:L-histidine N-alpha-methyltransferase